MSLVVLSVSKIILFFYHLLTVYKKTFLYDNQKQGFSSGWQTCSLLKFPQIKSSSQKYSPFGDAVMELLVSWSNPSWQNYDLSLMHFGQDSGSLEKGKICILPKLPGKNGCKLASTISVFSKPLLYRFITFSGFLDTDIYQQVYTNANQI